MAVPSTIRHLGLEPNAVLSGSGIDPEIFDDPDNLISFASRGHLLAHCAARTRCPHFGLLVGQHAGLYSFGLVGLLAKYSQDVAEALGNFVRYFFLHAHSGALSLQVQGDRTIVTHQIHQSEAEGNEQIGAGAVATLYNIVRELCGPDWHASEAWFIQRKPDDVRPFRQFFKADVLFNADQNALVFPSSWLAHALPQVQSDLRLLVQKQIYDLAALHEDDFPEQVRAVLRAALVDGDVRAERVAALFTMHPRTLNRHLHAYGFGYQQLLDETRFEISRQMLKDSDVEVRQIALMLGYADPRSFIRAFRRWSGETPARWRAARKQLRRSVAMGKR